MTRAEQFDARVYWLIGEINGGPIPLAESIRIAKKIGVWNVAVNVDEFNDVWIELEFNDHSTVTLKV